MKIQDIVELAKAGYKPADVLKLLEYVETSPAVQEAAPDLKPDDVPEHIEVPEPQIEESKQVETENVSVLEKLFE